MIKISLLIIFSFILGSIPFGVIIAKAKGIDLKKVGSGNIGATNVLRTLGKGPAAMTLLGDMLKGAAAVAIGSYLSVGAAYEGIMGISAILGHNFSLFLGFKGGKGVATSIGVLLIYSPQIAILTLIIWLVVVLMTKHSSLGAIMSFGLLPVNVWLFDYSKVKLITSAVVTILILSRHIGNIERLVKGTESKIGERHRGS
ncbi:MAG: glycerol-3-phosphate 1-O-acyltransferase PlsY [Thermodesulfovibrionales bacterium]|nr:glycerol-3-phosphate 1-O-acyltransferase PlsY [Thermodesulfovibrionales bacterium]